ncbi:MAG TPA: ABC-2 family transporter protein [Candidatus Paceibacterota bacterium]
MKELSFALYAIKKNIQSSAELRASFLMNIVGMGINNISLIILWVFFAKSVGNVGGWTAIDIIGLQGFVALCFGIVFSAGAGIRKLPEYITSGSFDRFMLSPKNLLIRISTASFGVSALGDVIFGIVSLITYSIFIHANIFQILLIIFLVIITTIIFLAIGIIIYSMGFLFTDATSVTGSFFDAFLTPALFHGGAFQGVMRFVFTFMIPSLLIGTLPVEIVRDISLKKLLLVVVLGLIWFIISIKIFNKAVKKYESSNFMTFGN